MYKFLYTSYIVISLIFNRFDSGQTVFVYNASTIRSLIDVELTLSSLVLSVSVTGHPKSDRYDFTTTVRDCLYNISVLDILDSLYTRFS